ncbi:MAG: Redoxin domain protein [Clostridia bacterium]|jgi:thiol peroxidase|nr:Redoxin domain protein [Clostridia bacterium]
MDVKFKGNRVTLEGNEIRVGDEAPDFIVSDNGLKPFALKDTSGKRVFLSVPSIDTPVCDMEVRRFNGEATKREDVTIYVFSMDLPFAQSRWCGSEGIREVRTLSDYKDRSFGQKYGTYIKELGLLTRAVFVIDADNRVTHVEYCDEVTSEPDYEEALKALDR